MGNSTLINIDQLDETLKKELDRYSKEVTEKTKEEAEKTAKMLVRQTKATAPRRRPRYYSKIASKKTWESQTGIEYTWYVRGNEYRLSHLLEKGHATKNGGRTKAFNFVAPATNSALENYIKAIENIIRSAGG